MTTAPSSPSEYIDMIRAGFVCSRCSRYVGSLSPSEYVPPIYPVNVNGAPLDDEVQALISFEWHMLGLLRQGKFTLAHPERDGVCVSVAEWAREDEDENEDDEDEDETPA